MAPVGTPAVQALAPEGSLWLLETSLGCGRGCPRPPGLPAWREPPGLLSPAGAPFFLWDGRGLWSQGGSVDVHALSIRAPPQPLQAPILTDAGDHDSMPWLIPSFEEQSGGLCSPPEAAAGWPPRAKPYSDRGTESWVLNQRRVCRGTRRGRVGRGFLSVARRLGSTEGMRRQDALLRGMASWAGWGAPVGPSHTWAHLPVARVGPRRCGGSAPTLWPLAEGCGEPLPGETRAGDSGLRSLCSPCTPSVAAAERERPRATCQLASSSQDREMALWSR